MLAEKAGYSSHFAGGAALDWSRADAGDLSLRRRGRHCLGERTMKHRWVGIIGVVLPTLLAAQTERGPYARIAIFHPLDGHTVDFEAAYIRHLAWHQQAKDTWVWYGYTINYSERRMWFIYASFGHSAASLDNPVDPVGDDRDNIMNVAPHVEHWGNALYEFLPGLSRGTGEPSPAARVEMTTVDLSPGGSKAFEAVLSAGQSALQGETLWYRMVEGGTAPRYLRLRPRPSLSAILDGRSEQALPDKVHPLIAKTTVEILSLRPTMSYGLSPARP
jgi:hypothetical protein